LRAIGNTIVWSILALLTLWAVAALYVDLRIVALRIPAALIYTVGITAILFKFKRSHWTAALCLLGFLSVFAWWLTLKPSNDGNWQADVERTAWAEMDGDRVTIPQFAQLRISHGNRVRELLERPHSLPFTDPGRRLIPDELGDTLRESPRLSAFSLETSEHIAFSIEARYKAGQSYSTILGLFRQYELIFIAADERDVIRLRTNYRKDEEVYLYRGQAQPEVARAMFLTYVTYLNN